MFVSGQPWSSDGNMKSNENGICDRLMVRKVTHITSSTWTTETLIIGDISKQTPSSAVKKEAQTSDSAVCSNEFLYYFMELEIKELYRLRLVTINFFSYSGGSSNLKNHCVPLKPI